MYNKLKELRLQKNMSYSEMAAVFDISKSYYWHIEHSSRKLSYPLSVKIAKYFNMTPDELFFEDYIKANKNT